MNELKPCPFCGTVPKLPKGYGTQYEIECNECGQSLASVQICDLMTIEERAEYPFRDSVCRYDRRFVERAKSEAIKIWNTRAQPSEVQQIDDPEKAMTYTHATTAAVVALNSLISTASKEANLAAICDRAEFAKRVLLEQEKAK